MMASSGRVLSVSGRFTILLLLIFSLFLVTIQPKWVSASPVPNPITQNGWKVYWEITASDGLAVTNVTYKGIMILRDGRLPGIVVKYLNSSCFFYDEIGSATPNDNVTLSPQNVVLTYPAGGGFNLTGIATVPGYNYQQTWLFYPDGVFYALMKNVGGGCFDIHTYEVRWRLDFALDGRTSDTAQFYTAKGWADVRTEAELVDSGLRDSSHNFTSWRVVNDRNLSYYIAPFDTPQAPTRPPRLLVVYSRPGEIENGHSPGVVTPYTYLNGERVFRTQLALWYLSQHTDNAYRAMVFEEPVLTGLVFYPSGF